MKYFVRIVLSILSVIIALLFIIAISFYVQKSSGNIPYFLGYTGFVNTGTSMLPTIQKGDLVILKKHDSYKIGDVISFDENGMTVTHRIINIENGSYVTRGDNNKFTDGHLVNDINVYGKMIKVIPNVGNYLKFFYNHKTLVFSILVSLVGGFVGINIGLKYVRKNNN